MAQNRQLRPQVSDTVTGAVEKVLLDAVDAGIDLDDIQDKPKIKGKFRPTQESLDELVNLKTKGSAIPGQSLTNSPDQPYSWEKPVEFANPRDAIDNILNQLLQPNATKEIINALSNGASVGDLAISIAYAKFFEGKINPDTMMLVVEPLMYLIMSIGEEANIQYNIDNDDIDEEDEEEIAEKLQEFETIFEQIQNGVATNNVKPEKINEGVVEKSLLDRVKKAGPDIRQSLLGREENE
tara:strand:+ start:1837 stop:2553 length:717 start_codon:yes stop_codon:yes gene_type:complete